MSRDDPVVERVRAARRKILADCGHDPKALLEWAKKIEAQHPDRVCGYQRQRRQDR